MNIEWRRREQGTEEQGTQGIRNKEQETRDKCMCFEKANRKFGKGIYIHQFWVYYCNSLHQFPVHRFLVHLFPIFVQNPVYAII